MSRHHLIEDYLDGLRVLPADVVVELTDGLAETYDHYRACGQAPDEAARTAIAEFGTIEQIIAAFDRIAPGRRMSRLLLATGPLAGFCWGTALIASHAWTWPVPTWAPPALGTGLLIVAVLLAAGALARRTRWVASTGAGGLVLLDTFVIVGVLITAPAMSWPLLLAICGSLLRAGLTVRRLAGVLTASSR